MSEGYVYILSNESMPGLVKIGRSVSSGRNRAKEIYQTGVPTPFKLEFELYVDDCVELESDTHSRLNESRVNPNREFFQLEVWEAIKELINAYLNDYCLSVHHPDLIVDEGSTRYVGYVLDKYGISNVPPDAGNILSLVSDDALIDAAHVFYEGLHQRSLKRGSK